MGREVKRVSLDFEWPIRKVWKGFINPNKGADDCPVCKGSGMTIAAKHISDQWYGAVPFKPEDNGSIPFNADHPKIVAFASRNGSADSYSKIFLSKEDAITYECNRLIDMWNTEWNHHLNDEDVKVLIEENRLQYFTHDRITGIKKESFKMPTALEVNEWSLTGFGHDSINKWLCVKAKCARLGIEVNCRHCNGEGYLWGSKEKQELYESWEAYEPPIGEGYQIWETVSEGSPISPVFELPESLASWMVGNSDGLDKDVTYDNWLTFIKKEGWAMSMVRTSKGLFSGVSDINI